ncbi:MAG TPA: Chromate resistance protein ChrB [Streptosporangiaceae bacterium]
MNGEAGPAPERRASWLILAYRLPARPRLQATIRRRLARTGAVYLANAVAATPASPAAERAFRRLRAMIGEAGGSAQVLRAAAIEGGANLLGAFNAAREQEYAEILTGCASLEAAIGDMTTARPLRDCDLSEREAALTRLSGRYDTVRARDTLGAANAEAALASLATCREVLDELARHLDQDLIPRPARPALPR